MVQLVDYILSFIDQILEMHLQPHVFTKDLLYCIVPTYVTVKT